MTDDVRPEVIKKTQDLLGKYFKKPPLTEKLLKKPPFRFLHDIISAVIRETGFLDGLFTPEELNSENIKDKEAKLAYLTKLIDVVKLITGVNLTVRASKIISGQEATKTNELLQVIGKALDKKVSSAEAIEHYKKGVEKKSKSRSKSTGKEEKKDSTRNVSVQKKSSEKEKPSKEQRRRSSSTSRVSNESNTREKNKRDKDRASVKAIGEKEENHESNDRIIIPPAEPAQDKIPPSSAQRRKHVSMSAKSKENLASSEQTRQNLEKSSSSGDQKLDESVRRKESASRGKRAVQNKESSNVINAVHDATPENRAVSNMEIDNAVESTNSMDNKKESHVENEINGQSMRDENADVLVSNAQNSVEENTDESYRPKTFLRPPSARPISARPAAPRMRAKTEIIVNEEIPTPMGNISVIVENSDTKDDDDAEDMVVMESRTTGSDSMESGGAIKLDNELAQEHGHLVAQILETQRELANNENVDVLPKRTDIAWDTGSKREREAVAKEIDKLRGTLQTLTRATNPLGKLLDYLQEDVEMMRREYVDWRNQSEQLNKQLETEKVRTKELIEPMKETLQEIENNMKIQLDKICQAKSQITKNDQKIQRLLNGHI